MTEGLLKSYEFRRERESVWHELDALVTRVEAAGIEALAPDELERLPVLYRSTLSSLSVARSISLDRNVLEYLESLAMRGYFCVYGTRTNLTDAARDFFFYRFPDAVRRSRWQICIATIFMLIGVLAGGMMTLANEERFYAFVSEDIAEGRSPASSTKELRDVLYDEGGPEQALQLFATFLFTHNAKVGILAFALGFALGVPVYLLLFMNGLTLGAFGALYHSRGLSLDFWGWILPHGITELLAVVICGGAGLILAQSLVFPGRRTRLNNLAVRGRMAGQIVLGAVVMFFIASLIEGIFRQTVQSTTLRYLVAVGTLGFWSVYFGLVGRNGSDGPT